LPIANLDHTTTPSSALNVLGVIGFIGAVGLTQVCKLVDLMGFL
jgi:hypothetical protein